MKTFSIGPKTMPASAPHLPAPEKELLNLAGILEKKISVRRDTTRFRRVYRISPKGREALKRAKEKVKELFGELFE